jgi:hypothetical protein
MATCVVKILWRQKLLTKECQLCFLNSITILYILKIKGSNHFEFDTHVAGYKQCNYTTIRLLLKSLGI